MVQRLFSVRTQDVGFLQEILPRFMGLYAENEEGRIKDDYEPIRMAVQLYETWLCERLLESETPFVVVRDRGALRQCRRFRLRKDL